MKHDYRIRLHHRQGPQEIAEAGLVSMLAVDESEIKPTIRRRQRVDWPIVSRQLCRCQPRLVQAVEHRLGGDAGIVEQSAAFIGQGLAALVDGKDRRTGWVPEKGRQAAAEKRPNFQIVVAGREVTHQPLRSKKELLVADAALRLDGKEESNFGSFRHCDEPPGKQLRSRAMTWGKASCKASFVKRSAEASKPCPVRVIRIDFVMSADVRFSANSGPIDWQLPALCRVPLAVEGNLLGSWPGAGRGARALALRALRHRVAAERQGPD